MKARERLIIMGAKKNKKYKTLIQFTGNNYDDVTGSSTLVDYRKDRFLVDFGFIQHSNKKDQYLMNKKSMGFGVKSLKNVLITHFGHVDHAGMLPALFNNGFNGKIYTPPNSKEYAKITFKDNLKILTKDLEYLKKTYKKDYKPFYEQEDVDNMIDHIVECEFYKEYQISEYTRIKFLPNYHIMNSASIIVNIEDKSKNYHKTIAFTGDIGNISIPNKPFLDGFEAIKRCDVLIPETTYAMNNKHNGIKTREKEELKIRETIIETIKNNARMLFCVFANQRTEEILYTLYKNRDIITVPVIVDSPLAVKLLNFYSETMTGENKKLIDEIIAWDKLTLIEDYNKSKAFMNSGQSALICACSGFLCAGRVLDYLKKELPKKDSYVVFTGYNGGEGSLGYKILNKTKVDIDKETYGVKATPIQLKSFSSHINHNSMLKYYSEIESRLIFLNHGDKERQYPFADLLQERLDKKGCGKVFIPQRNDTYYI